jgi:hypothetical protein
LISVSSIWIIIVSSWSVVVSTVAIVVASIIVPLFGFSALRINLVSDAAKTNGSQTLCHCCRHAGAALAFGLGSGWWSTIVAVIWRIARPSAATRARAYAVVELLASGSKCSASSEVADTAARLASTTAVYAAIPAFSVFGPSWFGSGSVDNAIGCETSESRSENITSLVLSVVVVRENTIDTTGGYSGGQDTFAFLAAPATGLFACAYGLNDTSQKSSFNGLGAPLLAGSLTIGLGRWRGRRTATPAPVSPVTVSGARARFVFVATLAHDGTGYTSKTERLENFFGGRLAALLILFGRRRTATRRLIGIRIIPPATVVYEC